jgi:hypothetical protein
MEGTWERSRAPREKGGHEREGLIELMRQCRTVRCGKAELGHRLWSARPETSSCPSHVPLSDGFPPLGQRIVSGCSSSVAKASRPWIPFDEAGKRLRIRAPEGGRSIAAKQTKRISHSGPALRPPGGPAPRSARAGPHRRGPGWEAWLHTGCDATVRMVRPSALPVPRQSHTASVS